MSESSNRISRHYGSADLENRVLSALNEAGKNLDSWPRWISSIPAASRRHGISLPSLG